MDHHGPEINEYKHTKVQVLMHRHHISVNVIGERLNEAVTGVKSMRGERGRNNPFVMKLF